MGKTLVIAEKPKAARALVNGLSLEKFDFVQKGPKTKPPQAQHGYYESKNVIITYAQGHLLKLFTIEEYEGLPEKPWNFDVLPYIPKEFKLKPSEGWQSEQLKVIKNLINDNNVSEIVHFGDPDNEGELLVREILFYCNNRKPVKRLWCKSLDPPVVADAYYNLEDINQYTDKYFQALARQQTDWLLGINLSRYMIKKTGKNFPVGRVLVPIVKYIYDRDMLIKNFSSIKTYGINALVKKDNWKTEINTSKPELIFDESDKELADETAKRLNSKEKKVDSVTVSNKKVRPKKLFNLSSFQSEMNKQYGFSLKESLSIAQSLYESGYITYPRTSAEYLLHKEEHAMKRTIDLLKKMGYPVEFHNDKSVFDDSKCVDGHTALIITSNIPDSSTLNSMSEKERNGYKVIFNRTISNFTELPIIEETVVVFDCDNIKFKTSGHRVLKDGFLKFEKRNIKNPLPAFKEGESVDMNFVAKERETVPPSHVSPTELLNYLKNPFADQLKKINKKDDSEYYELLKEGASLGTEATTAQIVNNAIAYDYIKATKKSYSITEKGIALIGLLDQFHINLYRERNVELSKAINAVGKKSLSITENKDIIKNELNKVFSANEQTQVIINIPDKAMVGVCPKCGQPVYERENSFQCSGKQNGCKFYINKNDKFFASYGKKITPAVAKKLLSKEHRVTFNKLKSKNGNEYSITIIADYENTDFNKGDFVKYKTEFPLTQNTKYNKRK